MTKLTQSDWYCPQVFCVSAHEALLGRLCLRNKLDASQQKQLHNRTFPTADIADIPPEMYVKQAKNLFLKSGMPELEEVNHRLHLQA